MENGADLVLELPTIVANSSSRFFALGAINLLSKLGIIDSICFGAETEDISVLNEIVDITSKNEERIWNDIQAYLKTGVSFAVAREQVLRSYLTQIQLENISLPNNILAIEYLKAIKDLKSNLLPFSIKREVSDFNEIILNNNSYHFTSATSIRNSVKCQKITTLDRYMPSTSYKVVTTKIPTFNDSLFEILKYKVITMSKEELSNIQEVTEGLENKIIEAVGISKDYEELVQNIKSKRYQMSKIKRMLNNILLNITKKEFNNMMNNHLTYAHVLACSENGKVLLSSIAKNSDIDLITSLSENTLLQVSENTHRLLKYDILASNIYSIVNNKKINTDYTNYL
ncbi:MAG: nucleotidyltransferase family protein [Clostridia bacterium]|nr:nucleotidyltransferase family protein [Clostridia bacterium]